MFVEMNVAILEQFTIMKNLTISLTTYAINQTFDHSTIISQQAIHINNNFHWIRASNQLLHWLEDTNVNPSQLRVILPQNDHCDGPMKKKQLICARQSFTVSKSVAYLIKGTGISLIFIHSVYLLAQNCVLRWFFA